MIVVESGTYWISVRVLYVMGIERERERERKGHRKGKGEKIGGWRRGKR